MREKQIQEHITEQNSEITRGGRVAGARKYQPVQKRVLLGKERPYGSWQEGRRKKIVEGLAHQTENTAEEDRKGKVSTLTSSSSRSNVTAVGPANISEGSPLET